jgi:hypothetical protein
LQQYTQGKFLAYFPAERAFICSGLHFWTVSEVAMHFRTTTISMLATVATSMCLTVIGCSDKAALRQEKARTLAASAPRPTLVSTPKVAQHFANPAPRDYALASYSDPEHGVSFRYPRNFALLESDDDGDSDRVISWEQAKQAGAGVRTADELSSDDPGSTLLATIVVPDDAYPNTSFAGGSLQFSINRYQTASSCRANLLERLGDVKAPSGTVTAQGVSFAWIDIDTGDGNTEFAERDYAGFANGACYEFFMRIGVRSPATVAPTLQNVSASNGVSDMAPPTNSNVTSEESVGSRRPNDRKIVGNLEKIVASFQAESVPVSVLDKPRYKSAPAFPASN